jgi:hypothetical protein
MGAWVQRFIGCDIDEYAVNESIRRLEEAGKEIAGSELISQASKTEMIEITARQGQNTHT